MLDASGHYWQMSRKDMVPDKVGTWMFHRHIDEHMEMGMMAMVIASALRATLT